MNQPGHLIRRAEILRHTRRALEERGYLEVDTPLRVRSAGTEVHLEAFTCEDRYLITSPEFHMKRLLAQGCRRIYQICHCFRKGERSPLHNPEFSMLEFYGAGLTLEEMMREVEEILWDIAQSVGVRTVQREGLVCGLEPPWERLGVEEAFRRYADWSPLEDFNEDRFWFDLVDKVDRHLGVAKPTILHHYPAALAMLAKLAPDNPRAARRFEVYVARVEIANAFEELTDSREQLRRFRRDLEQRRQARKQRYPIDQVFLKALDDLPPCCGIAVGLDRWIMLLLGAESVSEVMAFGEDEV